MIMIGRTVEWLGLVVLLLVFMAVPADADGLTITDMNWTYDEDKTSTSLTVCASEDLGTNIKLTVTNTQLNGKEFDGTLDDGKKCALFNNESSGQQLPSAENTTYELSTGLLSNKLSGSVSFSLEGVTIDCSEAQFLRFNYSGGGSVNNLECIVENEDSSVCYVTDDDSETSICFSGLDQDAVDLQVCVQRTAFDPVDEVDPFTAEALRYETGDFTFSRDDASISLAELLIFNDTDSSPSLTSCTADTCVVPAFEPSTALYTLCGVFTGNEGTVSNSGVGTFQDMNLKVVDTESTVDFYFINKDADKQYHVYSTDSSESAIKEFNLDCSHIDADTICNGFFDLDPYPAYVAVSYDDDGTNKIISPTPQQELS